MGAVASTACEALIPLLESGLIFPHHLDYLDAWDRWLLARVLLSTLRGYGRNQHTAGG